MRYRIAPDPAGRYVVLPAPLSVVLIDQTYAKSGRRASRSRLAQLPQARGGADVNGTYGPFV